MKKIGIFLFMIIAIVGCSSQQDKVGNKTVQVGKYTPSSITGFNGLLETPSVTIIPTVTNKVILKTYTPSKEVKTQLATELPTHAVSSPTTTFTPTPTIFLSYPTEAKVITNCLEILPKPPSNIKSIGKIVLKGYEGAPSILLDMDTWLSINIPDAMDMVISPNGKWLAYIDTSGERSDWVLNLVSNNEQKTVSIPWEPGWFGILQWLDDEWLLISKRDDPVFLTILLNPFNGERIELTPNYPDIYTSYPHPVWGDYSYNLTVYDKFLSRVIYPDRLGVVLWDLENDTLLAHIKTRDYWGGIPKWAPDGRQFVIKLDEDVPITVTSANELYSLSSDGVKTRLTYLSNKYSISAISEYSWSPDGRYIAFWMIVEPQTTPNESLAILDLATKKVTNYCVPGMDKGFGAHAPVWSPNGQQLAVENIQNGGKDIRVILVDIHQEWAAIIGENRTPVGWMASP